MGGPATWDAKQDRSAMAIRPGIWLSFPATAPFDQGGEMRAAFTSIEKAVVTYLEGVTGASQNAEPGNRGGCRRR